MANMPLLMPDTAQDPDVQPVTATLDRTEPRIVTKLSHWSVPDTATRLSAIAAALGMKIFAVIDHAAEAREAGLALHDSTVVIVGSAQDRTPIMQAAPLAGLDLPLRVLIWSDEAQTKLSYTAPAAIAARFGVHRELAEQLAEIDLITDAAARAED